MQRHVILISGKQGAGKTTAAQILFNYFAKSNFSHPCAVIKFADPLYEMHDAVKEVLKPYGFEPKNKWGVLLQLLGTEFGRKELGYDVWTKICANRIDEWFRTVDFMSLKSQPKPPSGKTTIIIDDLRFKNEFEVDQYIRAACEIHRLRLEACEETRKPRCENWRDDTNHISETDLDDWRIKFDKIIETDKKESETEKRLIRWVESGYRY